LYTYRPFVLLIMLLCRFANAQTVPGAITQAFDMYRSNHLQEKLFVHTDKSFYMAGEIIWFKVYATDAQFNLPLDLSKVGYVEILSKEHKPVFQAKIALADGAGNGSFQLPYSVNSGTYILRAYTNWMKNGSPDYFFEKDISIVNALKKPDWPVAELAGYDIQFFPEGGNLVNGLKSKLAFKVVDMHGNSKDCSGAILNQRNDTVVRFNSLRFGMGHFDLTPTDGEQYHAVIKPAGAEPVSKKLPVVNATGMVMRVVEIDKDRISLTIQSSNAGSTVSVLVHARQSVRVAVKKELLNGKAEILIDKKQLGEGVSHFTVFNESNQPVCERLYFKRPEALSITAKPDAAQYGKRKKVTIDLATNTANNLPVAGNLSMSVFLLDSLQSFESSDILTYLWLQSDLKGNIESPTYYFSQPGAEVDEATDNLMLTQGWRRFRWENIMQQQNNTVDYLPETEGHIIQGKIIDKRNGQPAENIAAYLSVPAEKSLFTNAVSGRNGIARFAIKNFYGGNEVIVQTNSKADSVYRIDMVNPFSEKYSTRQPTDFLLSEKQSATLLSHSLQTQVGNAYFGDKHQSFLFPKTIDTIPFYGVPDRRYYLDDYTRFITMEEVMHEYVEDVRVRKNNDHFTYRIRNKFFDNYFETAPLVLLDGVPVFDVDKIMAIDPLKIKRVDVVSQKFYQHNMAHDGIVNYSSYQGDLAGYPLDVNALIVEYEGLQLQREFYSPVYEDASNNSRLPDLRNQLYWSPDVRTDKNGKKQLSFYTADIPGTYGIVIQGISANGLAGSKTAVFTVGQ
jgi:hypothetical protein